MKTEVLPNFSPQVFWDVCVDRYNYKRDKDKIIGRVMNNGTEADEILLYKIYSYQTIKRTVTKLANLNQKTVKYLSVVFNIKETKFTSYNKIPWYQLEQNISEQSRNVS